MKKILVLCSLIFVVTVCAQESANRFFYELTYKPSTTSIETETEMMILDLTKSKSIYRDYLIISQDSLYKSKFKAIETFGAISIVGGSIKPPKFTNKVIKEYPSMKIVYIDNMLNGMKPQNFGYEEQINFNWKILPDKIKIGEYNTQKAKVSFGGRNWVAWFCTELPFQDGPYKFYGLPGLIVKLEDDAKNYSWILKGNQTINNYIENSYFDQLMSTTPNIITKAKFEEAFGNYKKNPLGSLKTMFPAETLDKKMPGSNQTLLQMMNEQEKKTIDLYKLNNNTIEKTESL